jgi:glycosyltransferase involved in cell wall biosynthesis
VEVKPTVSVVIIFLNAENFLLEAIASVFAQTYDSWELLLVDDGSSDSSSRLARDSAGAHPSRVRYLDHPDHVNRGMSASRNLGIRHARGRFIALLDADDVWLPSKLEEQIALLEKYPEAGMVCGASEYWHSWNPAAAPSPDKIIMVGSPLDQLIRPPDMFFHVYPLAKGSAPCPSSLLFRRSTLEEVGGFQDFFPNAYEDQACLGKVYLCAPVYVSSKCWDRYRQHGASCTWQISFQEYHRTRRHFLLWFKRYLQERPTPHPAVKRLLAESLKAYRWFRLKFFLKMVKRTGRKASRAVLPPALYKVLRNCWKQITFLNEAGFKPD